VYVNKKESETYLTNFDDYEAMCARDRRETGEDNKRKRTKIMYEWGFYGWVRLLSGEIAYIHHTNYAVPDLGIAHGTNVSDGIDTQFMMSMRNEVKTPKPGDYVCLIVAPSTQYKDKLEGAPWFTCSYTLYRCINIVKNGRDSKMSLHLRIQWKNIQQNQSKCNAISKNSIPYAHRFFFNSRLL